MEQQQKQQSFRGLQDNLKRSKIHVIGVSEEMERDWSTPTPQSRGRRLPKFDERCEFTG